MYKAYNPNPAKRRTDDCVVRAVCKALGLSWLEAYDLLAEEGRRKYDLLEANHVWIGFLKGHGFVMRVMSNLCPDCYTVRDFCADHPYGMYILGDGKHVVTVVDGDWYDTWDSGDLVPTFFLRR